MQKVFHHCSSKKRLAKAILLALLAAALLLSGCGDSSGSSGRDADALYFSSTEKAISDPKAGFESNPENQGKNYFLDMTDADFFTSPYADAKVILSPENSYCENGNLYFLYSVMYQPDESKEKFYTGSYCLAALGAPYEQWEYHIFTTDGLTVSPEDNPAVRRILAAGSDGVYLLLSDHLIAFYNWDGSTRSLDGMELDTDPAYLLRLALYSVGGKLYAVSSDGAANGSFTAYDKDLQPVLTQNLEHTISGCISRDSECLWYGFDEEGTLTVWDEPNGTVRFSLGNMVNAFEDFRLTRSAAGEFILASKGGVWTGDGTAPLVKVLSFAERGYILDELLSVIPGESGGFSVIVYFENGLYLLTLEQRDAPDKQEITVVSSDITSLEPVIAAFNRQSDKYRVVLVNPFESGDIEAYCQQLQMEISTGKGPDLMEAWLIDWEGCIQNGYLEPLGDAYENPSEYWPAVLEAGKKDDVLYSICYRVVPSFLAVSKSLAGDLESWDTAQMMEAVKKSPAESLQMGLDSMGIVLQYGLADRNNPQFIDYDAGVSHLTEQPFLDFLEFAKNYGDDLYYAGPNHDEAAEYYQDGRLAAFYQTMYGYGDFLYASACFQGQEVLIGLPSAQGRGIYMSPVDLCLNSSSPSVEGAKDFLRYLVSAQGQLGFHRNTFVWAGFSCRRDVVETLLNEYQEKNGDQITSNNLGMTVTNTALTEEQVRQFMALFEDAKPAPEIPGELENIIREELAPYFAGDCSAEEAAGKLHSRVQIYLEE